MGNYLTIFKGRRPTREVRVGDACIGGGSPVSVQSMTNTPTTDTEATVSQIIRIAGAGADIVRLTVRSIKEAENLSKIKSELRHHGCFIPLVADVHFNPAIAEVAAAIVEKVRINPGNYGIASGQAAGDFSDEDHSIELGKARTAFSRLIDVCRKHNTALRIGVNHGSLSPRIINRYGNTPEGMASSAMEFLQFCREEGFHNVVVSLKSSNTLLMVSANRLMVEYMKREEMDYPLHLGVTEAGEGEDGRIRSVAGIGTLLASGIGDTIRVSLTEDPEREIPVARKLIEHIGNTSPATAAKSADSGPATYPAGSSGLAAPASGSITQPSLIRRRLSVPVCDIGGDNVPVVLSSCERSAADYRFSAQPSPASGSNDPVTSSGDESSDRATSVERAGSVSATSETGSSARTLLSRRRASVPGGYPLTGADAFLAGDFNMKDIVFVQAPVSGFAGRLLDEVAGISRAVIIAVSETASPVEEAISLAERLEMAKAPNPVILKKHYASVTSGDFQIIAAADFSALFIDRLIDGLWLEYSAGVLADSSDLAVSTAFSILQSTRARITKTEFISCPSCGRTMFDIQKTLAEVKVRTSHLKGLKIAVMGCIVNGPGEMADADFGIVGSGRSKVTLYKKQSPLLRNVPEEKAVDELIRIIRESGDWQQE